jgi:hypothetical protein
MLAGRALPHDNQPVVYRRNALVDQIGWDWHACPYREDESLHKILLMVALALVPATALFGATKRNFQTGKLLGVTTDEKLDEGTSYRWAIFTVQVSDLVITARGDRVRRRSGDIGQGLIIGDAVQVAIDGGDLIFLRPDGKELKTKIVKRERAP